jgi:ribosome-associated translation inhibitor RaiA
VILQAGGMKNAGDRRRLQAMELPLQITWRGLGRSPAIESAILERARKLEHFHRRIVSCRVVIEQTDHHKRHGRQFAVRLDVRVPGAEVAIDYEHDEDVYIALRDAFADARRKLAEQRKARRARAARASGKSGSTGKAGSRIPR